MTLASFMKLRLVRLYPLYLAGTLIGAALWWLLRMRDGASPEPGLLGLTLGWQALFLPVPPGHSIAPDMFYPLNGPAWTLLLELVVNLCLALSARFLRPAVLAAIVSGAAIWLVAVGIERQTLDVGWSWPTIWDGGARTAFSFFAGVALYRLHLKRKAPAVGAWLIAAIFIGWITLGHERGWWFDLASVGMVFPGLIWLAANARSGPAMRRIGLWSGYVSYPIYALHVPLLDLYYRAFGKLVGDPFPDLQVVAMTGYVLAMIALAWLAARFYDDPVRR
jgi:peptidoglycan/LPS O-acetylase OafA/YrhL